MSIEGNTVPLFNSLHVLFLQGRRKPKPNPFSYAIPVSHKNILFFPPACKAVVTDTFFFILMLCVTARSSNSACFKPVV